MDSQYARIVEVEEHTPFPDTKAIESLPIRQWLYVALALSPYLVSVSRIIDPCGASPHAPQAPRRSFVSKTELMQDLVVRNAS
jgi:hypothetical protein